MNIELSSIKKIYNDRIVLNIEGLKLQRGKIYAVLGPNGSGKTTLLRMLAGIEACSSGTIEYDNSEVLPWKDIAYMLQSPYMFNKSVIDNVLLGAGKQGCDKALKALEYVGMEGFLHHKACSLSGGEAQKVAVARTLAVPKKLILLDEPTAAIDISSIGLIDSYIKRVNIEHGATIIFTTHNINEAIRVAHEAIVLWNGSIIEAGDPETVLKDPKTRQGKEFIYNWSV